MFPVLLMRVHLMRVRPCSFLLLRDTVPPSECDIILNTDRAVSRHHADLVLEQVASEPACTEADSHAPAGGGTLVTTPKPPQEATTSPRFSLARAACCHGFDLYPFKTVVYSIVLFKISWAVLSSLPA